MIATPAAYAPLSQVRRVGFAADFRLIDLHAADNASVSTSAQASVSRDEQLVGGITGPSGRFVSLEPNLWLLDGSLRCVDAADSAEAVGWWSLSLSGTDRTFPAAAVPTVTFSLSAAASSIGFTLYFDGDSGALPAQVKTTVYAGATQLATHTDAVTDTVLVVDLPVEAYDRVVFAFPASSFPGRRVRLMGVVFGVVKSYAAHNLSRATITYGASQTAESFPSRQLNMTIDNSRKEYNMRNPDSIYAYLQDGQEIRVRMTIGGVAVDMGRFHFTSASAKDSGLTAELVANDRAYTLDGSIYVPGSHADEILPLGTAVSYVLGARSVAVEYGAGIQARQVRLSPPEGTSVREVLRLLAQAARCAVWFDRSGVLRFGELVAADEAVQSYGRDALYSMDGISVRDKVDKVSFDIAREQDKDDAVYSYGDGDNEIEIKNPCVAPEQAETVAQWLHGCYAHRVLYKSKTRGDPAVEIGDTVEIADTFGDPGLSVVTELTMQYNGGLNITVGGVGA